MFSIYTATLSEVGYVLFIGKERYKQYWNLWYPLNKYIYIYIYVYKFWEVHSTRDRQWENKIEQISLNCSTFAMVYSHGLYAPVQPCTWYFVYFD